MALITSDCAPFRSLRPTDLCSSLAEVACHFDLLSHQAFADCNVRRGVWAERFDAWLPLVLDDKHARSALPLLETRLSLLASPSMRPAGGGFNPLSALEVLPRVMNVMVVSLMTAAATSLHASEKALLGFCALHHMLLELAAKHPVIRKRAAHWVGQFELHASRRNKHVVHGAPPPQHGLSSNKMAPITSDCGVARYLRIRWP